MCDNAKNAKHILKNVCFSNETNSLHQKEEPENDFDEQIFNLMEYFDLFSIILISNWSHTIILRLREKDLFIEISIFFSPII